MGEKPPMAAVVIVEFALDEDETFQPMFKVLCDAIGKSGIKPVAMHAAIREAADRVLAALTAGGDSDA